MSTAAPLSSFLIENCPHSRGNIKRRLYAEGLKERICELCGQGETWYNKQMALILDHINGTNNDYRLENLRIICPNCNATLETNGGKNMRRMYGKQLALKACARCGTNTTNSKYCSRSCSSKQLKLKRRKVERPSKEILLDMVWKLPSCQLAPSLGVSDRSIGKWCKSYGISKPPRGFWAKAKAQ